MVKLRQIFSVIVGVFVVINCVVFNSNAAGTMEKYESIYEKQIKLDTYKSAIIVEEDILKWFKCHCRDSIKHCHDGVIQLVG